MSYFFLLGLALDRLDVAGAAACPISERTQCHQKANGRDRSYEGCSVIASSCGAMDRILVRTVGPQAVADRRLHHRSGALAAVRTVSDPLLMLVVFTRLY
jgi:hypothetical protein